MFSYEAKVIIKYLWIKYKYDAARIVNYHPEYEWAITGLTKPLKKLNETGEVAPKEGSRHHKSVPTEENNNLENEKTLSEMKLSKIAREFKC